MSARLADARPRSTTKDYDLAIYIGRFQPFHKGHLSVVRKALDVAERVLILVGSANRARDTRNPFLYEERELLVGDVLGAEFGVSFNRVSLRPLNDTSYDNPTWIAQVHHAAKAASAALRPRVCLIGNVRDATSEYLSWFPEWEYVPVPDTTGFEATRIRKAYFSGKIDFSKSNWSDNGVDWDAVLPHASIQLMTQFRDQAAFGYLLKQKAAEEAYRAKWGPGPFLTVDPVIVQGGYVAMIERGGLEGEGMVALPGGFHNAGETARWGAAREAVEETAIFIPLDKLADFKAWLEACKTRPATPMPDYVDAAIRRLLSYQRGRGERFDDPHRSRRGHLITEAFLFVLPDGHGLPRLEGCDDARHAFWNPASEVTPLTTFEDHAFIIDKMINLHF